MPRLTIKIDGRKLAELRFGARLSQRALGEKLGVTETRIRHLERGADSGMYPENFRKLAKALAMSEEDLLAKIGRGGSAAPERPAWVLAIESLALAEGLAVDDMVGQMIQQWKRARAIHGTGSSEEPRLRRAARRAPDIEQG